MPNEFDTDKQEQDLFLEISKAIREDDHAALDRLVTVEEPVVAAEVVPTEEVKEVVTDASVTEETKDDTVVEEVSEEVKETPPADDPSATIARLQEELEAQKTLNHKLKSDAGRVPSLQRKLAEVDNKLREMAQKTNPSAATTREDKRVLSEKLAQIKEHDPLLADAVMELVNDAVSGLRQDLEPKVTAVEQASYNRELEQTLDAELAKLKEVVPNAIEVFQSSGWKEWKADLPANWLALAESIYAEDVVVALQRYSQYMYQKHPELLAQVKKQQTATTTTAAETTTTSTDESEKVKQQRQQKLTTKTPGSSSVSAKDTPAIDEEALFAKAFKEETAKFKRG